MFIACCVWTLIQESHYLSTGYIDIGWDYSWYGFFGTLCLYNVHRYISFKKTAISGEVSRFDFVHKYEKGSLVVIALSGLSAVLYGYTYALDHGVWIGVAMLLGALYVIPTISNKRLRDIGWIKLPILGLTYAIITSVIPCRILDVPVTMIWWYGASRILFITAITIPFEIRDRETDASSGLKTIAHLLTASTAKKMAYLLLLAAVFCATQLHTEGYYDLMTIVAVAASCIITGVIIHYAEKNAGTTYYLGLLDGTMLLNAGAIFIAHLSF